MKKLAAVLTALSVVVFCSESAHAEDPKFDYGKKDEVKGVEWKASAKAGLIITTGNSRTTTISGAAQASRKAGANKLQLEAGGAFARSSIFLAVDENTNGTIEASEVTRPAQTTAKAWLAKARYDRFLAERDSLYVTAIVSGDRPAGKDFVGGGQLGYSRTVIKDDKHELLAETGYDYSYEKLVASDSGISIHSARFFGGYVGKLTADTSATAAAELLLNVNKLDTPVGEISAFKDARFLGKVGLTTKLWNNLNFAFGFTAKYDHAPAPRKPFDLPYADGFLPLSDKLDTITEASLVINFL